MGALYQITFPGGKSYIGITAGTAGVRFAEHAYNATRSRERAVERAIRKYGPARASLRTLAIGDWGYLVELEKAAIRAFGTFGRGGYNMTAGGEGALGYRHTAEALVKMGAIHKGRAHHTQPHTDAAKAKMSRAAQGRKPSPSTRAKISAALVGNQRNKGKSASPETRERMAAAQRGKVRTQEQRANISRAAIAREALRRQRRNTDGR